MRYAILDTGESRSFPGEHALRSGAAEDVATADVVIVIGSHVERYRGSLSEWRNKTAVLIELGTECLGVYTGETRGEEGGNVLGFARFRLGESAPSNLIELVRQPRSHNTALAAAMLVLEDAGLQVAICGDFAGRIIDRLVRPYYNSALRRLDEALAIADDLDTTLKLGLGYPEGPIALLDRTGLAHHFDVTQTLFETYGDPAYAPARRARVAKQRQ